MARWVSFTYQLDDVQRMARMFPLLDETAEDLSDIFEDVAAALGPAIEARFDAEGPGWKQLAPATVAERRWRIARGEISVGPAHPILEQTGALRRSLVRRNARGHVERIEAREMEYGTSIEYAPVHQYGGVRVPQRMILDARELFPVISRVFEDAIPTKVRRAVRAATGGV